MNFADCNLLGPYITLTFHDINQETSRYDGAGRVLMVQVELCRVGLNEYYSDPKEVAAPSFKL
jgi:hypothetical protein